MSSTCQRLSGAETEALAAEIQAIPSKQKLLARPILQALLDVAGATVDISPVAAVELLQKWLSRIQSVESLRKISASETTIYEITEAFNLKFDKVHIAKNRWKLAKDNLLDVPPILQRNLDDLQEALYDDELEASCRIAIDIMLIQCRKYLRRKHQSANTTQAPRPKWLMLQVPQCLKMLIETTL